MLELFLRKLYYIKRCQIQIVCLLVVGHSLQEVSAQNPVLPQTEVDSLLALARKYTKQGQLVQALRHYLYAVRVVELQQNQALLTNIEIEIGLVYQQGHLYQKSLEYFLRVDSIKASQKNNKDRAWVLDRIGTIYYQLQDYSKARNYFLRQVQIYQLHKQEEQLIKPYRRIIECYQQQQQYKKVLEYNLKVLKIIQKSDDQTTEITALNNIGFTYKHLKDYANALRFFKESLQKQTIVGASPAQELPTWVNMAIIYQNQGRYEESITTLLQAIRVAENTRLLAQQAQLYDLLALVYYYKKDYYNAQHYNQRSIELSQPTSRRFILQEAHKTASLIYQKQDNYEKALASFQQYLLIKDSLYLEEIGRQQALAQQKVVIEKAEKQIKLIMAGEEIKNLAFKRQELEIEKKRKEFELLEKEKKIQNVQLKQEGLSKKQALQALQLVRQKASAAQKDRAIVQLQAEKRQKEQVLRLKVLAEQEKQRQIQLLEKEKQIKELDLQAKKQEIEEQQKVKQYFVGAIGLGVLAFILILTGWVITRKAHQKLTRQKHNIEEKNAKLFQVNEELEVQRDLLETKKNEIQHINQDLTESLFYAQHIQEAMLPSLRYIQTYLPASFILFKPRDIVSGDFYWFTKTKSEISHQEQTTQPSETKAESVKLVLAAVDCTGHGVPGALMSMTGKSLLNEIVEMRGIERSDHILRQLHRGVKKTLKQDETNNRDGMDMALCVIDPQKREVEFAGAKSSLIVVHRGQLKEIRGDKMPIGGEWSDEKGDRRYTRHSINLGKEEAVFYMFSDGYHNQFGGSQGKKFMKGRFKQLLLEISSMPMAEQKRILEETMQTWMIKPDHKIEPQIDDILVMGFKMEKVISANNQNI